MAVLGDTVVLVGIRTGPDLEAPSKAAQYLSSDGGATWSPTSGWPATTVATDGRVIVAVGDGAWITPVPVGPMLEGPGASESDDPEVEHAVPNAVDALECDFERSRMDIEVDAWSGDPGYESPEDALRVTLRGSWSIPRSGYRELAGDESSTLYGYRHRGEVKVALRVERVDGTDGRWLPVRLVTCRLAEWGRKADLGPGVWLWANRWDRTIPEWAHCDHRATRIIEWLRPDDPQTLRATRTYVRDPRGMFGEYWAVPYRRSTSLPADARYTGYRRDGAALWLAADERAMYVKKGAAVERWPRVPSGIGGCA